MSGIGERYIGAYRLLRLLMTGQNSQVWEAMHRVSQKRVALKTLLPEFGVDKEQVGYLRNEYAVGSTLEHPRVIQVFELGFHDNLPFMSLEFYPYPNIKFYIQQSYGQLLPLTPRAIEQAAEGLAYFHSQGWVHRDIKPDNFLLSPEGNVKLIDFALAQRKKGGLSKLLGGKSKVQGTRSYMSPEQIRGHALDARADIYSFGCMVHEMVGGRPPFTGADTRELLTKHLRSLAPSLLIVKKEVTSEFADLVQRLLAKSPGDRPETMEKFLKEFRTLRIYKQTPRTIRAGRKVEAEE